MADMVVMSFTHALDIRNLIQTFEIQRFETSIYTSRVVLFVLGQFLNFVLEKNKTTNKQTFLCTFIGVQSSKSIFNKLNYSNNTSNNN